MSFVAEYQSRLQETLGRLPLDRIEQAIEWLREARESGNTIYTCGNGGSAATASHFVCDILKGASFGRDKRFRIQGLTDSLSTITAYSNDVSYDIVFEEQLKNFGKPGDVVIAVSGSGNSPNVLRAIEWANAHGLRTIGLTGRDGGQLGKLAQLEINASDPHMGRIEDAHMIVLHMIGYYFMEEKS
jgi:D-sedoheptulose 7-phosphate isomerase